MFTRAEGPSRCFQQQPIDALRHAVHRFLFAGLERLRQASLLVLLAPLLAVPIGKASSFRDTTLEELAVASDLVAQGTVVELRVHDSGPGRLQGIHSEVRFQTERLLGGKASSRELVFWAHGGRLCDRMRIVHGQARFAQGERLVMFLFRDSNGNLWPTGMARGKWLVCDDTTRTELVPSHSLQGAAPLQKHDSLPLLDSAFSAPGDHCSQSRSLSFSELEARVYVARGGR